MPTFKRLLLASLLSCLSAACASSPASSDSEGADQTQTAEESQFDVDTTDWTDDRRALEEEFWAWLQAGESLDAAMAQGADQLQRVVVEKTQGLKELETQLQPYLNASDNPEVVGWAALRSAQTYLHIGCEINAMSAPQDLSEEQKVFFRESTAELSHPLLDQATTPLRRVAGENMAPWSEDAEFILARIEPMTAESCEATAEYWRP